MSNNSTKKTTTVNKAKKVSEVTNVENKDVNVTNNDLVDNQENNITNDVKSKQSPKIEKAKPKKYAATDPIICMSITPGELGMIGLKSGTNYTWNGRGDEIEVEYHDLVAAIRVNKKHITEPYFIIQDPDFLAQYPDVEKIYSNMYTVKDLKDVLKLEPSRMKELLIALPNGAREAIKNIASTMIANGTLDSINRIKVLDEVFDINLMLMTELHK